MSQAPSVESDIGDLKKTIDIIFSGENNENFLVVAAGNNALPLEDKVVGPINTFSNEEKNNFPQASALTRFFTYLLSVNKQSFLIAGAVDGNLSKADISNYPGENIEFQKRFLCTLGENVSSLEFSYGSDNESAITRSGTSFAAPTIVGSMALLKSKYPYLSFVEIKEILLESAEKNFFKSLPGNGNKGIFVYDPDEGILPKDKDGVTFERFSPEFYGRGVLSLMRAFIFADTYIKMKEAYPRYSSSELLDRSRNEFKRELGKIQNKAATKIQSLFRGALVRKKLKRT